MIMILMSDDHIYNQNNLKFQSVNVLIDIHIDDWIGYYVDVDNSVNCVPTTETAN